MIFQTDVDLIKVKKIDVDLKFFGENDVDLQLTRNQNTKN